MNEVKIGYNVHVSNERSGIERQRGEKQSQNQASSEEQNQAVKEESQ